MAALDKYNTLIDELNLDSFYKVFDHSPKVEGQIILDIVPVVLLKEVLRDLQEIKIQLDNISKRMENGET